VRPLWLRSGRFADGGVRHVCTRGGDGCSQFHRAYEGGVIDGGAGEDAADVPQYRMCADWFTVSGEAEAWRALALWGCFRGVRLDGVRSCGLCGCGRGDLRTAVREVCARGAAMDAGNKIQPAGAASLVPALEKMPQLTSLNLAGARIGLGRGSSVGAIGGRAFEVCDRIRRVVGGFAVGVGAICGRWCARCVREGWRWMQSISSGPRGWRHWCRRWRRCRS
jgi:hypothetical protein